MTGAVLRLRAHEVWSALEVIDPVAVLAEDLIGRTVDRSWHNRRSTGRLVRWRGSAMDGCEYVLLDHPGAALPCVLPAHSLRVALASALAAVAARELLLSAGVTVAMVGSADTTQPQLSVIARHVPDISHVALCLPATVPVEPKLADQLELSGIGLSVVRTLADTVFGANLVVVTDHGAPAQDLDGLRVGQLARGAVVVNATGKDLPADLVDQVDQVYVDDFGLLDDHRERRVVAAHLAGPRPDPTSRHRDFGRRIAADLCQLLTGPHARRRRADDVALVELLGVHDVSPELANQIYEGANRTGLGERIAD